MPSYTTSFTRPWNIDGPALQLSASWPGARDAAHREGPGWTDTLPRRPTRPRPGQGQRRASRGAGAGRQRAFPTMPSRDTDWQSVVPRSEPSRVLCDSCIPHRRCSAGAARRSFPARKDACQQRTRSSRLPLLRSFAPHETLRASLPALGVLGGPLCACAARGPLSRSHRSRSCSGHGSSPPGRLRLAGSRAGLSHLVGRGLEFIVLAAGRGRPSDGGHQRSPSASSKPALRSGASANRPARAPSMPAQTASRAFAFS